MKRYILACAFTVFALLLFSSSLYSQKIRGGITLGMNLCQVDGDEVYGFHKAGFHGGAIGIVPLKNNFLLSLETLFSQKGAYQNDRSAYYDEYRLKLDYVEIPVMLHYNDRDIFMLGVGFSFAKLVKISEWEHGIRTSATLIGDSAFYDRNDYSVIVDLRFRVYKRLKFNIRYQYSMNSIRTRTYNPDIYSKWTRKQYNNHMTFRFVYVFNDPLVEKEKTK